MNNDPENFNTYPYTVNNFNSMYNYYIPGQSRLHVGEFDPAINCLASEDTSKVIVVEGSSGAAAFAELKKRLITELDFTEIRRLIIPDWIGEKTEQKDVLAKMRDVYSALPAEHQEAIFNSFKNGACSNIKTDDFIEAASNYGRTNSLFSLSSARNDNGHLSNMRYLFSKDMYNKIKNKLEINPDAIKVIHGNIVDEIKTFSNESLDFITLNNILDYFMEPYEETYKSHWGNGNIKRQHSRNYGKEFMKPFIDSIVSKLKSNGKLLASSTRRSRINYSDYLDESMLKQCDFTPGILVGSLYKPVNEFHELIKESITGNRDDYKQLYLGNTVKERVEGILYCWSK